MFRFPVADFCLLCQNRDQIQRQMRLHFVQQTSPYTKLGEKYHSISEIIKTPVAVLIISSVLIKNLEYFLVLWVQWMLMDGIWGGD